MSRWKRSDSLASSKDQNPVRGARRENNDVRNGIPERKVPVIGNLSLLLPFHPSFLLPLYTANVRLRETAIDNSLTPRGKIGYESPARFPQRWKEPAQNLIREKDKRNKKTKS